MTHGAGRPNGAVATAEPAPEPEAVSVRGVSKRFGRIQALDGVNLTVGHGQILALVGDNGAGKSTLMKIITGLLQPDAGELVLRGTSVGFRSPTDARDHGIAAVFQDLALVECLDIATNLFLGEFPKRGPIVDRRRMDAEASEVLSRISTAARTPRTRSVCSLRDTGR